MASIPKKLLDYMMKHRPATVADSAPLNDLENVYPGIYNIRDRVDYKTFEPGMNDNAILNLMASVKNKPDAMVEVYRAVPKGVRDFNTGDWITLSKPYAREHGKSYLDNDFDIIKTKARAADISNPGDSIMEQGYWGAPMKGTKTRGLVPFGIGAGTLASAGFLPDTEASAKSAYIASPEMKAAMMGIRDEPVKEAWNPVEAFATAPIGAFTTGARAASVGIDALLSALLGD